MRGCSHCSGPGEEHGKEREQTLYEVEVEGTVLGASEPEFIQTPIIITRWKKSVEYLPPGWKVRNHNDMEKEYELKYENTCS